MPTHEESGEIRKPKEKSEFAECMCSKELTHREYRSKEVESSGESRRNRNGACRGAGGDLQREANTKRHVGTLGSIIAGK